MIGAGDLAHRLHRRLVRRQPSSISRSTFSTTTIASSTTRPIASTSPNSVSVLIEKPSALITAKVPISETGHRDRRDQRGAEALEEHEDDEEDEQHRLDERREHLVHRLRDEARRCRSAIAYVDAGGKRCESRSISARTAVATSSAFALGSGKIADADRRPCRERGEAGVALRAELDPRDVAEPQHRAVGPARARRSPGTPRRRRAAPGR